METLQFGLILSTLLCSLVAGLVFAFACVVMPGIGELDDRAFIQAFQVMDRVIQNNQPIFLLVWVGSALTLIASCVLGVQQLAGVERALLLAAGLIYIFGVQVPTVAVNVPLNNQLQTVDVATVSADTLASARKDFEPRWNRWNFLRTVFAVSTSIALLVVILRL